MSEFDEFAEALMGQLSVEIDEEKVIEELNGVLTINKLQGDAALFYAIPDNPNQLSELILEKLQTSFKKFNQHINDILFCET